MVTVWVTCMVVVETVVKEVDVKSPSEVEAIGMASAPETAMYCTVVTVSVVGTGT